MDTLLPYRQNDELPDTVAHLVCRAEARQLARLRTRTSQQRQCRRYNKTHRPVSYEIGDLVLLWTPHRHQGLATKFLHRYVGPYVVVRKLSDLSYHVQLQQDTTDRRRATSDIVHVARMKPYTPQPTA